MPIIGFNPSRFADKYVPSTSLDFLKMPENQAGGILPQELHHLNGTQRWVKICEAPVEVFEQMAKQFKPSLQRPLHLSEIKCMLQGSLSYWPHAYALCVMACEQGDAVDAKRYFGAFASATTDKPYSWVETRRDELSKCMKDVFSSKELTTRLQKVRAQRLLELNRSN